MASCPSCGTQVEGKFCPRCGTAVSAAPPGPGVNVPPPAPGPVPPAPPANIAPPGSTPPGFVPGTPPPQPPSGPPPAADLAENVASALCYIPLGGVLFLAIEPYNRNPNIRFHAWQSNFFWGAAFALGIALSFLTGILPYESWRFISMVWRVYDGAIFVGFAVLVYKALTNERWVMPIIGEMAQKQR